MKSHGDGRRMTLAEAVERRARMIRFHGSLEKAYLHGHTGIDADPERNEIPRVVAAVGPVPRAWSSWFCHLQLERERDGFECGWDAVLANHSTLMVRTGQTRENAEDA